MKNLNFTNEEVGAPIDIGKPSKEEYEKAQQELVYFGECIRLSVKRKNELLDELCREREAELQYRDIYDMYKEIVRKYEIYEELAANE